MTENEEKIFLLIRKAFLYGRAFETAPESFGATLDENDIIFEIYNGFYKNENRR